MTNDSWQRKLRGILGLTLVSWLAPIFVMFWAPFRLVAVARVQGRVRTILAFSLAGNFLFVLVLVLGYYESTRPEPGGATRAGELVAPECIECPGDPFRFCQAPPGSELARIIPNAIYVASADVHRVRFEFSDTQLGSLVEVTLSDAVGRPWIDANLEDGTVIYSRYSSQDQLEPEVSLLDEDGDGIPDVMMDWALQQRYQREGELLWVRSGVKE